VLCSYLLQIATDVVGLVDEWAARFFEELDYVNEGENATRFASLIQEDLPQVSLECEEKRRHL
jgi:aarF domain-containing kinase